jgi:nitroreductase
MDMRELVIQSRSYRRFNQSERIDYTILEELVDIARLTSSARNMQPLKYMIIHEERDCEMVFATLSWAGALRDWAGPEPGERPSAYVLMLLDTEISDHAWVDPGIAGITMRYAAAQKGLGGCLLGAVDKTALTSSFDIPKRYQLQLVLALGTPAETIVLEDADEEVTYYRSDDDVHHVPKRRLKDVLLS